MESDLERAIAQVDETQQKLIIYLVLETPISITNMEYMNCYDLLCKVSNSRGNKDDEQLFNWFSSKMQGYLEQYFHQKLQDQSGEQFLQMMRKQWNNLLMYLFWLRFIFSKFDQSYQSIHPNQSLTGKAFVLLQDIVFVRNQDRIHDIIFNFLNLHRNDEQVPIQLVIKIIQYFVDLGFGSEVKVEKKIETTGFSTILYAHAKKKQDLSFYDQHFKKYLIENTREYWIAKTQIWLKIFSVPEFVKNAKLALEKEHERANMCFPWNSQEYMDTCEREIIAQNAQELLQNKQSGLAHLIMQDQFKDIDELFKLMNKRRTVTIPIIAAELNAFIKKVGMEINESETFNKDPREYMREVIGFYKKVNGIIQNYLGKEQDIQEARDKGFQHFLNKFDKSIAFLARNCDYEMRLGMKGNSEEEIEEKLQSVIDIFLCFHNRDSFILQHQKLLSVRLLTGQSLSDETEKRLITLIKHEMGKSMTNKLTEMCSDLSVNQETMLDLKRKMRDIDAAKCDVIEWKITILTSGHWQIDHDQIDIPAELTWISDNYVRLYKEKNKGRKITWAFSQGNAEVQTRFDKKYNLDMSNYQLLIVLLFNQEEAYTFKTIQQLLRIPVQELHIQLSALCRSKLFLRNINPDVNEFADNEVISVNLKFTSKMVKIKLQPTPELRKQIKNQEKGVETVDKELEGELKKLREFQLDACIVRVMKTRKRLPLNELNQEILKIMAHIFKPQPAQIKARIESLIERDYISRDGEERTTFLYKP